MHRRYITQPHLAHIDEDPDGENYLSRTVFEQDRSPRRTGLLDAQGNQIFAIEEMDQIGFVRASATS